jgi:hypothetical protein
VQAGTEVITERDDAVHEHGGIADWRERLTFAFFDAEARVGCVARMVMLPGQTKAEATVNVFLPDRSLATVLIKGPFDRSCSVGRLEFTLDEALKTWRLTCHDTAIVLHGVGPGGLPSGAERSGSAARIELDLRFEAWTEPAGGAERSRLVDEMNFVQIISNGRFEQAGRVAGTLRVGGHQATLDAGGVRERAWGWAAEPRGSASWWMAAAFGPSAAVSLHGTTIDQTEHRLGWLMLDGKVQRVEGVEVEREREGRTVRRARARLGDQTLEAEVRATVPIRDGGARVQQSMAAFRLGERTAWGLAEFADHAGA